MFPPKHYHAHRILSRNAFLNFIIGIRNTGKTWAFKIRAWRRFLRKGKKTVWVRRTEKEVKDVCRDDAFYKKLRKKLGLTDKNFKWQGRRGYANINGRWVWFIEVVTVLNASKGADDPDVDTVVYDEFTATKRKLSHYHGNEVEDFFNLVITKKRDVKDFRVFFLGNDETFVNPYYVYLNIPSLERDFVGIRSFKNHSIAVEIIDPSFAPQYDDKVTDALKGTRIFDYLSQNTSLDTPQRLKTPPPTAKLICQIDFSVPCSLWAVNGEIYVKSTVDRRRIIYSDRPLNTYNFQIVRNPERKMFDAIADVYKMGRFYYADGKAYEAFTPFLKYLNLI